MSKEQFGEFEIHMSFPSFEKKEVALKNLDRGSYNLDAYNGVYKISDEYTHGYVPMRRYGLWWLYPHKITGSSRKLFKKFIANPKSNDIPYSPSGVSFKNAFTEVWVHQSLQKRMKEAELVWEVNNKRNKAPQQKVISTLDEALTDYFKKKVKS